MREIKFRGKRVDNGKWETGCFVHGESVCQIVNETHRTPENAVAHYVCDVAPETVGQFTGLLDKNGKEIYEGDMLGRHTDCGEIVPLSIIVYADNGFFAQSLVSGANFNFKLATIVERQEVIDNIHNIHNIHNNKTYDNERDVLMDDLSWQV